jgi:hypothetical protein
MAVINSNNGIPEIISRTIAGVPGADGGRGDSGDTGITGDAGGVKSPSTFFFAAAHVAAKKMLRLIAFNSTTHLQVPKTGTLAKWCKNRTLSTIT